MKTYKRITPVYRIVKDRTAPQIKSAKITTSMQAHEYIKQFLPDDSEVIETMHMLLLNSSATTTGYIQISRGGTASTVVDPKIVAKFAVDSLATAVVLMHNHPSGSLKPSNADIAITKRIKEGLKLLDITLMDHIITTGDPEESKYLSFADEGLL